MEVMDTSELWGRCLKEIELTVSRPNFSTWFKNTSILREDQGTVYVGVPNEFVKEWLSNKYQRLILKALMGVADHVRAVEFTIIRPEQRAKMEDRGVESKIVINRELPLQEVYINKEDNLNPRYTFSSFVVGSFNELAHAAARAVVEKPGASYNPLFIYGPTGLGKTHLIQSIGNAFKQRYPDKKVHYITFEKFSVDYVNAIQSNKPNLFKEKYRRYDLLIMDDIQFVSGKEKTQEELFHLFNTLYDTNKQIVFSSDKHPNFISGLEDRLKSRFSQGMVIDVSDPDYESRLAILKSKVRESNIPIDDEVVSFIADAIEGNIRELEGSLNTIVCQTQLKNRVLTIHEARQLIKNNVKPKKNVAAAEVVKVVADFYKINEQSVYEKTRRKEIVKARQMIMYILREEFSVSYPLIGQKLGGKDHTTVIHSYEKIKNDLKRDPLLVQELEQIRVMFK
jgi:chromosomal replication initiator protein